MQVSMLLIDNAGTDRLCCRGKSFDDESPNLEFVWPSSIYVVKGGNRTDVDLNTIPARV